MSRPKTLPHLPAFEEDALPDEVTALFQRAHQKLGADPLPCALRGLGASPVLFRDTMLNLEHCFADRPPLPRGERLLCGLGVAVAAGAADLANWIDGLAGGHGVPEKERRGAVEISLACRTLNAYYRAKSLLDLPGAGLDPHANLRATPLVSGALPKRTLELLCTAVSVLLNCRSCVTAHARAAFEAGADQPQVDEAIRVQAVVLGLALLET